MNLSFFVFEAGKKISEIDFKDQNVMSVGRAEHCDIRLQDRAVSSEHFTAKREGEELWIERVSEFGVVLLNGVEISRQLMKPGDQLQIGKYEIHLKNNSHKKSEKKSSKASFKAEENPTRQPLEPQSEALPMAIPEDKNFEVEVKMESKEDSSLEGKLEMGTGGGAPFDSKESNTSSSEGAVELSPGASEEMPAGTSESIAFGSEGATGSSEKIATSESSAGGASGWAGMIQLEEVSSASSIPDSPMRGSSDGNSQASSSFGASSDRRDSGGSVFATTPSLETPGGRESVSSDNEAGRTRLLPADQFNSFLEITTGAANVSKVELQGRAGKEVKIGRGKDCDIVLEDKKSSRNHCVVHRVGNQYEVKDLESANGTFVNGDKIIRKNLSSGDKIRIGDTEIRFNSNDPAFKGNSDSPNAFLSPTSLEPSGSFASPAAFQSPAAFGGGGGYQFQNQGGFQLSNQVGAAGYSPMAMTGGNGFMAAQVGYSGQGAGIPNFPVNSNGSLLGKFRAMSPRRQLVVGGILLGIALLIFFDDEKPTKKKKVKRNGQVVSVDSDRKLAANGDSKSASQSSAKMNFERLTVEQKKFVEDQHRVAFDFYRMRDYDKALFEVRKIFDLIPEYKDAREIERYSLEGIQKREAIEAEKLRREQEERLRVKIAQQVEDIASLMKRKKYEAAETKFAQVLASDPENPRIKEFQKEIEQYREKKRLDALREQVEVQVTQRAMAVIDQAKQQERQGRYQSAIQTYRSALDLGSKSKKIPLLVQQGIARSRASIARKRQPLIEEAAAAETAGQWGKAYAFYGQALRVDPSSSVAASGVRRTKEQLTKQNKELYTEAILAESYSDFDHAQKKYLKIIQISPPDDLYARRARSKLKKYKIDVEGRGITEERSEEE